MNHRFTGITPIRTFGGIWVKREDWAHWSGPEFPSGSKVRQYVEMANHTASLTPPPCIVGCSANSAMQIYVAATAKQLGTLGIIYTAKRKDRTAATLYAERMGAEIIEIKPGYLSKIRKEARQRSINLGQVVPWDRTKAIVDTVVQCANIPLGTKRIVVPTGSGLTAAGLLIGTNSTDIEIVACCTSPMADTAKIILLAQATMKFKYPTLKWGQMHQRLIVEPPKYKYDIPVISQLPDGTPLDPFYSAKAWEFIRPGDLFWPVGLRPVCSMPDECQIKFQHWKGPI